MTDAMKPQIILLVLLLWTVASVSAVEIKLADASASASVVSVTSQPGDRISVEFRPVTTLDEISNREMSETLAQFYAEEALSSFLHASKAIVFSKAQSILKGEGDNKARCVFNVPAEAIIDAPFRNVEKREEIVGKRRAENKVDANTRILDFRSTCFRDLRIAETLFSEEIATAKNANERAASQRKIKDGFSALRLKIKADDSLFRSEKAELIEKVDKVENYLLTEAIGEKDKTNRTDSEKNLPILDAVFKEPFGDLLKADPILLTHGGARFIEMADGRVAILAVGFTMAENEDKEDIAELKASAELGKLRGGEEAVVGNKIERQYRRSSSGNDVNESMELKRSSTTIVNSMDFHKTGETVGTWLSADGKRFFLAKGRIVRKQPKEGGDQ